MVHIERIIHKGEKRIKIIFGYDKDIIARVKQIPDAKWSRTMNCWHVPDNEKSGPVLDNLTNSLKRASNFIRVVKGRYNKTDKVPDESRASQVKKFIEWLKCQRYSEKTIQTYSDAILVFLRFHKDKTIETIDNNDLVIFNQEYILSNNYSVSYQNQVINAIKLFFKIIENKIIVKEEIVRPRSAHKLPDILSPEEIENLLKNCENKKHQSMLALIYACGLRRSELINLQPSSVDSKRKLLLIKAAKGKKDRVVPLPDRMIGMLRDYYKIYRPEHWLFEGNKPGERYAESSLQQVFRRAISKSKIKKDVTLHSLRHSYATHLLENGIDLRFIQEILGHKSSKTTEIYTHVTRKSIERIKSPFENLKL